MKKPIILLIALSLPWVTGCRRDATTATPPPANVTKVVMQNMQFSPATVEITKGGTIEWTNEDMTPHTATSPTFGDSGSLASGQSWSHAFNEVGEFPYVCTFHPTMTGSVIVK